MKKLAGVLPPIPTPFDHFGRLALDKLRENFRSWLETGLHGFVVLGSNGEYVMLSDEEKFAVWETARAMIPSDRLFIAGAGAESTQAALHLIKRAAELGADYALVVTPNYYKNQMNRAAQVAHYRALADSSPLPILIYNVPANTGIDLDAATILEIAMHPNVAGMKDSGGNLAKMGEILANAKPDFAAFVGTGSLLYPAMAIGARGCVPALGNVAPHAMVQIYDDFLAGRHAQARDAQVRLVELNRYLTALWGVPALKAALDLLGYYGGPCRMPLLPLDAKQHEELKRVMEQANLVTHQAAGQGKSAL